MCGWTKRGRPSRAPGFQGNSCSRQTVPSRLTSITISGRWVVMYRNSP